MTIVSHLLPGVNTVAVCAEEFYIVDVFRPVLESSRPSPSRFVLGFLAWIDMIYIEDTIIGIAARDAAPTKKINKLFFALPDSLFLSQVVVVFIPVFLLTFGAAKFYLARFSAVHTFPGSPPSFCVVTIPATELSGPLFYSIGMHLKQPSAMLTLFRYSCLFSHTPIICNSLSRCKKFKAYFEIAKRRIQEALIMPKQEVMW